MVSCFVHVLKLYRTKVLCGSVVFVDVLFLWIGSVLCFIVIATRIYLYCMKPDIVWHLQIFLNSY